MWFYAARRIVLTIPIALGVTIICFALVYIAPGDPIASLLPPNATASDIALLKHSYGLDRPIPIQYLIWLGHALTGNLGRSIQNSQPVAGEVLRALSNTLLIAILAVLVAFSIALVLGMLAAYRVGSWVDRLATGISVLGISVPSFWLGVVLVILFAVKLHWLPATGMGTSGSESFSLFEWKQAKFAILPVVTMALTPLSIIMRTTRSSLAEVLGQDFVQTLRAKGLGEIAIMRHAIWNAMPQILAMLGLQLGYLLGGSILIETIFTWPGTGYLLNKAILTRDIPLLQGAILILAMAFVAINLVVDLLQTVVDPRIKRA
ncbi:peptide/nickel transport system permease protein [Faunimonas pinastri]|uniref:Peptide/nickel transport system permease protein n=1 Tax=Faunimonas pinastri TaxID=1855383 RepID=A0A1H9E5F7_9HYPH|nr:ABC transporter permease [Faunimonas pinastri]SEQ20970.1 peptide/nickel transport system permease protein [Faunimonas pinastri]